MCVTTARSSAARFKVAESAEEIDEVLRLRHRVYVEEEGYFPKGHGRRIVDRFDAYPTTVNIITLVDGAVVGTLRLTTPSLAGAPHDEFGFDFDPFIPESASGVASGSRLCVERAYRNGLGLARSMMYWTYDWARANAISHMISTTNPKAIGFFTRCSWRPLAGVLSSPEAGLEYVPVVLDLADVGRAEA